MHDDQEFTCQRHFGFFRPCASDFIAQLFSAMQPLSGLVRIMCAAS
jgi:hypothetical protein